MNRRNFLKIMCGTGAALLSSRWNILKVSADLTKTTGFDKTAAARELSAHRIMNITARRLKDRYPRFIGPNSQGGGRLAGAVNVRFVSSLLIKAHLAGRSAILVTRPLKGSLAHMWATSSTLRTALWKKLVTSTKPCTTWPGISY